MTKPVKIIMAAVFLFILLIIQTTVLDYIRIFGIMPNILLISVICYSFCASDLRGLVFGVLCGIFMDVTGGRIIGINTLLYTYAAFSCLWVCDKLYNNNEIIAAVFTFVISLVYGAVVYITNFLIWGHTEFLHAVFKVIIPETIYNTFVALFIYPAARFVASGPKKKRKKQEKYL